MLQCRIVNRIGIVPLVLESTQIQLKHRGSKPCPHPLGKLIDDLTLCPTKDMLTHGKFIESWGNFETTDYALHP
jgi:hypothetical protein